jgi:hypothetical protein
VKSFTISPPPGETPTLQDNTGRVTFTVTNTATRTVSGTVMAKPQPPAEESWFTFAEGATRSYQPGAVMSVATTITVPAGTAAGTYTFRLDAKAEDNPDEDYTEGPSAQFIVPAAPKPVPWWKRYWWIIAIVAVVLIGIVLAIVLLSRDDDEVAVTPTPAPPPALPDRNCLPVNGNAAAIAPSQIFDRLPRFAVSAAGVDLGTYATPEDANRVAELARAFARRCAIGSVEYWVDRTGEPLPEPVDCFGYDPGAVEVVPAGSRFAVRDPQVSRSLGTVGTRTEADDLEAVAVNFRTRCFIGAGQARERDIDRLLRERILDRDRIRDLGDRFEDLLRTTVMDYWLE